MMATVSSFLWFLGYTGIQTGSAGKTSGEVMMRGGIRGKWEKEEGKLQRVEWSEGGSF
jgi:hypothetical protein